MSILSHFCGGGFSYECLRSGAVSVMSLDQSVYPCVPQRILHTPKPRCHKPKYPRPQRPQGTGCLGTRYRGDRGDQRLGQLQTPGSRSSHQSRCGRAGGLHADDRRGVQRAAHRSKRPTSSTLWRSPAPPHTKTTYRRLAAQPTPQTSPGWSVVLTVTKTISSQNSGDRQRAATRRGSLSGVAATRLIARKIP